MAKKQFSYNQAFTNTDWDSTQVYNPDIIDKVVDPGGGKNTSPANAIPSPFARMDLVRTAFRNAGELGNDFAGLTDHDFKLISDAWDVGELFFRRKELFDTTPNVRIIEWDRDVRVNGLINSDKKGHQKLGKALRLFFDQDKEGFNFDDQSQYYLFQRDFKTYGGTSPLTLFFSSADPLPTDLNYMGDVFFDEGVDNWKHLHQRGDDFQEFIHLLFEAGNFRAKMPAMDKYLTQSFKQLQTTNAGLFQRIGSIRQLGTPLPVAGTPDKSKQQLADGFLRENYHLQTEGQHQVKVLGYPLYTPKQSAEVKSDFFIESDKTSMKVLVPLNEDASLNVAEKGLTYYGGLWDEKYRKDVPFKSSENWKERPIPAAYGKTGAVLLVGDLLEDVILKVKYPIDKGHYFSLYGDAGVIKKYDYLLPLKKTFFEFFDHNLLTKTVDGKKTIELEEIGSAVKIYLRIPIKSNVSDRHIGHVEFTKIYSKQVDSERNKGMILENDGFGFDIGLAMTPSVRWNIRPDYRVHLMDIDTEKFIGKVELAFYSSENSKVNEVRVTDRRSKHKDSQASVFYNVKESFDWIDVEYEFDNTFREAKVVPLWKEVNSNVKYDVSVDFGTTNTHIEIRPQTSARSSGFETSSSHLISTLFDMSAVVESERLVTLMDQEFVPKLISETYRFPKRTVISHSKSYTIGGHSDSFALGDYNYPFVYEIRPLPPQFTEVHTDLKWSVESGNARLLDGFIENIALLIRSKILADGGDPKQTSLFITHPTSMTAARVTIIEQAWEKQLQNLFGVSDMSNQLTTLTESLAPYVYYSKTDAVAAYDRPVVSIDIGGGTTDIIVVDKKVPSIVSSVRFAGNSLFGDGYNSSTDANGFIKRFLNGTNDGLGYLSKIQQVKAVERVYTQLRSKSSADIISFLFSLKDSKDLAANNISIDFARDLSEDKNLRTVFVIFYSSIVFHVARQMKLKGLRLPSDLLFSGTGSRILLLLDSSSDKRHLSVLTKEILRQVYTDDIPNSVKIRLDKNPKELTAKGAILFDKNEFIQQFVKDDPELNNVHAIMQRLTQTYVGEKNGEIKLGSDYKYESVSSSYYESFVRAEFDAFLSCMEAIHKKKTLINDFDVQAVDWSDATSLLRENFVNGLKEGMEHKLKEVNDKDSELNESPFFYPLHYALCLVADKLTSR